MRKLMRVAYLPVAIAVLLPAGSAASAQQQKPLTVDAIFAHGPLIGNPPEELTWSPDGKHLTYIDSDQLIDLDPGSGRPHVLVSRAKMAPLTEAGGSERDRDHRNRYHMASYLWAPDSSHLLFNSSGRLWYYDLKSGTGVQIADTGAASGDDPKFSPDGNSVSFLRNHGIEVVHVHGEGEPPVSAVPPPSASSDLVLLNGGVDWVYEEELETRSNYFWSPDSKSIAFLQMNETSVPQYPLTDWIPRHATVEMQRYPQPGDPNPDVHLGVVGARGGRITWMHIPFHAGDDYIPRFGWVDSKTVWLETVTRDHKHRTIYFCEANGEDGREMLDISDDKYVDDNYDVTVQDGSIVLTNWTSGHNQIYLYSYNTSHPLSAGAKLERQLTSGDFEVSAVYRVDTKDKFINYASNEGNVLEQQLWQVSFDGQSKQLTTASGFHDGNFAPAGASWVDKQSTRMEPPRLRLCASPDHASPDHASPDSSNTDANPETSPETSRDHCNLFWQTHAVDPYHLRPPEQLEVKAHDGTTLFATLLLPANASADAAHSVPLIVNPYGGPGPQEVANRWGDALLFDELLAQHGFAVLHADNRGTGSRGRAFAQVAYHNFGPVQLEDQLTVIDAALGKFPQLDPKRLGWWGWSWGGTFTLYAMTHSDRFRAGVAVAPVTHWRNYDSIYTERYMGLPTDDASTYERDSVVNSAANLKGHLLIAHGTGDDNVHIGNTVQFVQALIEAGLPYDLQIYPRKTHSIAGPDVRTHLYNRILAQFETYLMPEPTAAEK
jgi:dipeptidyl-peptidase 4